ncbi:MAG: hypothetical protein DLM69_04385 [Candidatus Chloroheliales bacterium]|nr:MAG: hypothetical protein DLM69_04385 [Chloroflexota bacterium]
MGKRAISVLLIVIVCLSVAGGDGLAQSGSAFFAATGHTVKGRFLAYWQQHGGLSQFGYPISDEFQERSELNSQTYTVQYFERAVFEFHPENQPPYDVLLSQLGTFQFRRKYPNSISGTPNPTSPPDAWAGLWQRPLKLHKLASGAACPISAARVVSPDFGPALGAGPVYPVGLGTGGTVYYQNSNQEGGWFYVKILWVGDPQYKGPILIRGQQLDGANELRFESGADPARELRLHTNEGGSTTSGWYNWPSYTRIRAAGCYAWQVDGLDFTAVIVFKAVDGLPPGAGGP